MAMFEGQIRIGSIAGIAIKLHWSLLVVFWLITWTLATGVFPLVDPQAGTPAYWGAALVTSILYFSALLAHELGHSILAKRKGLGVEDITLWIFGGVATLKGEADDPVSELWIAAIGPLVSLLTAGIFLLVKLGVAALGAPPLVVAVPEWLALINAMLAVFNLLPAFPMDGGRVLRAWLWKRRGDRVAATRTAARTGRGFGYAMIGLGLLQFVLTMDLSGLWFVFLGWFLLNAARAEESGVLVRTALKDIRVRHVMTPNPMTLPADMSVQYFAEHAMEWRYVAFPVTDDAGNPIGLITLNRVKEVPLDARATLTLGDIACPLKDAAVVSPDDNAATMLERLQSCADGRALVFDGATLVGIVSPRDIQRTLDLSGLRAAQ